MSATRDAYDVVVAGSGPAGSTAALVLARDGARVLLVDPDRFPRDKACGDLVGPRGVTLLGELGVAPIPASWVADIEVVAPSGRSVTLPWPAGRTYAGQALSCRRADLDAALRDAALAAGAEPVRARVAGLDGDSVLLSTGRRVRTGAVIGADGAMSRVATVAGLVRPPHVLWGMGVRADRHGAAIVGPLLPEFVETLRCSGHLSESAQPAARRGGWMRMGVAGIDVARAGVLLCGDAAGLVNPLQGEGISEAMLSGRSAADALAGGVDGAAERHRQTLAERHGRFHPIAAATHAWMLRRPRAIGMASEVFAAMGTSGPIRRGSAIWWHDLLQGAELAPGRTVARILAGSAALATANSAVRRDAASAFNRRAEAP